MIQRIQSLFLLLAAIAAITLIFFPLFKTNDNGVEVLFKSSSSFKFAIIPLIIALLSFGNILMYKNRKVQLRICLLLIAATCGWMFFVYFMKKNTANSEILPAFWGITGIIILLALAALFIRKDEKMIAGLNRFR